MIRRFRPNLAEVTRHLDVLDAAVTLVVLMRLPAGVAEQISGGLRPPEGVAPPPCEDETRGEYDGYEYRRNERRDAKAKSGPLEA